MKKVIKLLANWHQYQDGTEAGENYDSYEVGKPRTDGSVIVSIEENEPRNGMQLHNFVIKFDTGKVIKVFNPNYVEYESRSDKQQIKTNQIKSNLKHGDIIEIQGYYFTWEVRDDYSPILDKFCLHAVAQEGLIHTDLVGDNIISINGKDV